MKFYMKTDETFTTAEGEVVRYQDIFSGIDAGIRTCLKKHNVKADEDTVLEIFQKAVLKFFENIDNFHPEKCCHRPGAFGFRIGERAVYDNFRKNSRYLEKFTGLEKTDRYGESYIPEPYLSYLDEDADTSKSTEYSDFMSEISEKMGSLNENYRDILGMKIYGFTPEECVQMLGCSPGAYYTKLSRAKDSLRKKLGDSFMADYGYEADLTAPVKPCRSEVRRSTSIPTIKPTGHKEFLKGSIRWESLFTTLPDCA